MLTSFLPVYDSSETSSYLPPGIHCCYPKGRGPARALAPILAFIAVGCRLLRRLAGVIIADGRE